MKFSPLFLIFLLFLGLRLGGVINWSWFWVFSPIIANILIWAPLWYYQMKLEKLKKIQEALREAREKEKGTYGKSRLQNWMEKNQKKQQNKQQ